MRSGRIPPTSAGSRRAKSNARHLRRSMCKMEALSDIHSLAEGTGRECPFQSASHAPTVANELWQVLKRIGEERRWKEMGERADVTFRIPYPLPNPRRRFDQSVYSSLRWTSIPTFCGLSL